jgi:hypothetical protein
VGGIYRSDGQLAGRRTLREYVCRGSQWVVGCMIESVNSIIESPLSLLSLKSKVSRRASFRQGVKTGLWSYGA